LPAVLALTSHGFEGAQEKIGDDILFLLACPPEHGKDIVIQMDLPMGGRSSNVGCSSGQL
jgi:hypothetical protein